MEITSFDTEEKWKLSERLQLSTSIINIGGDHRRQIKFHDCFPLDQFAHIKYL